MSQMLRRLRQFKGLRIEERRFLASAAVGLAVVCVALRAFGLGRLQAWLRHGPLYARELPLADVQALGRLLNVAARHVPWRSSCLARSLLLGWLLRRRGAGSQLRIGVRMVGARLEAHAWVEYAGVPVNDREDISLEFAVFNQALPLAAFSMT